MTTKGFTGTQWTPDEYCDCDEKCQKCGKKRKPLHYWCANGKTVSVSTKGVSTDDDNTVTCEVTP